MATKYYAVLTNVGAAKLANATALGAQVEITQMAVGDGNGVLPTPNPAQTALVHELRRKPLNSLSIDPNNANQIIAEQVIPEDEGGWWIREIGLFDKDGDMIAVANCAETYKPQLQEGSGRVQVVRMILIVSSTAAVTLKIDPSVVLATRKYVDDQIIQVKSYVDQKMAAHVAAADPHKQYAPKESPALTGRPTAPTAEGKDSSTQIANTAFVQAAIAALVGSSPEALDTLNELAAALGNDPNFATTVTNSLAGKMDKSANGSDIENVSVFLQNLGLGDGSGRYSNVVSYGVSGTYTWPADVKFIEVIVTGAGGGGGGCNATSASETYFGAGGGAGGTAFGLIRATDPGAGPGTYKVTVGLGGTGGEGASGGSDGGDSVFMTLTGFGGKGAKRETPDNTAGGAGGLSSGGYQRIAGGFGEDGQSTTRSISGKGGGSFWGGGGIASNMAAPIARGGVGDGGGGAYDMLHRGISGSGANGGNGVVIIREYR
ncbi:phage tail protein [Enterobacter hormaechei]|uniref:phage tail protein n=1 Tax=Enterobacter hormaechei TaxID=158836 RepID=UPI0012B6E591|nr:phage tail protein [Enterobacter hormaechei]